jgi:twitching motility protein PilT
MTVDELGLPKKVLELCHRSMGLVLVTGPTGSGKTTTLATLINYINETFPYHIITIEDPIEYVCSPRKRV